jgi:SagB-type dehydrogenase family enzyme
MQETYRVARKLLRSNWELLDPPWKSDMEMGIPVPDQEEPPKAGERIIPLVSASKFKQPMGNLLDLLRARKSRRSHSDAALSLAEFSFLCWAAAGIKEHKPKFSLRTVPSGGARHPLDLYFFVARVDGLETGLYRYLPVEHAVALVRTGNDSAVLNEALRGQYWNAAVVFVWVAVPYRSEWRYGPAAHKLVLLDAGLSCENLYLACESIGEGTCVVGAYDQEKLDAYLGLDGEDSLALCAAPVGKPAR